MIMKMLISIFSSYFSLLKKANGEVRPNKFIENIDSSG